MTDNLPERFCLNTATIKNAPLDLKIELVRRTGFRQIGLWLADIEAAVAQGESLADLKARLDASGLRVAEICFLGGWMDANAGGREDMLNRTRHICEAARAMGCDIVIGIPALAPGHLSGAPERFRQVCQVAAELGVRIALEFPGNAPEVKDLGTAWELVSAADCRNGGLVIDTFHFFVGGSKIEDFERVAAEKIFLVHVSDAMNLPLEKLRIPHDNRTFPGEGLVDYAPIFEQLDRLEYEGPISLEIMNRELHQADPLAVLAKGRESLQWIEPMLHPTSRVTAEG